MIATIFDAYNNTYVSFEQLSVEYQYSLKLEIVNGSGPGPYQVNLIPNDFTILTPTSFNFSTSIVTPFLLSNPMMTNNVSMDIELDSNPAGMYAFSLADLLELSFGISPAPIGGKVYLNSGDNLTVTSSVINGDPNYTIRVHGGSNRLIFTSNPVQILSQIITSSQTIVFEATNTTRIFITNPVVVSVVQISQMVSPSNTVIVNTPITISVTTTGGLSSYTYEVTYTSTGYTNDVTVTPISQVGDTYNVTVTSSSSQLVTVKIKSTDSNGFVIYTDIPLRFDPLVIIPLAGSAIPNSTNYYTRETGIITVTASGGSSPYQFSRLGNNISPYTSKQSETPTSVTYAIYSTTGISSVIVQFKIVDALNNMIIVESPPLRWIGSSVTYSSFDYNSLNSALITDISIFDTKSGFDLGGLIGFVGLNINQSNNIITEQQRIDRSNQYFNQLDTTRNNLSTQYSQLLSNITSGNLSSIIDNLQNTFNFNLPF